MTRSFSENMDSTGVVSGKFDPLLADREVAQLLGCGRSTIWRWASDGTIPKPIKIGGLSRWRFSSINGVIQDAESNQVAA